MANFRMAMIAMAAALAGSQAMAADVSPLAPGKPAGVSQARHGSPSLLLIGGGVLVAVGAVLFATMSTSDAVCGPTQGCVPIGTTGAVSSTAT
jgi:hypothetical protein